MKSKRVLRYYCDHCKKSGCSKFWMKRHEDSCIRNPARICRFHSYIEENEDERVATLPNLIQIARNPKGTLEDLREFAMGCPACMLAAIVQSGRNESARQDEEGYPPANGFSLWRFKDEKAQFWDDRKPYFP